MSATSPLWLVGCGNMGGAMLRRWIEAGVDPSRVTVIDPGVPALPTGVRVVAAAELLANETPGTVVLAVKPQQLRAVWTGALAARRVPMLVSILAGADRATLSALTGAATVVRAMPNLPVVLGKGVVALNGPETARAELDTLMAPLGLVEWIEDEALFDVVTALSGSGPGFVYRVIDALGVAGAALGLPADQAARLALATVDGAAALAAGAGDAPATLAERVASPGGSTRAGLDVLDAQARLVTLMTDTLRAAAQRNRELAAMAR